MEGSAGRCHDAGEGQETLRAWIGQLPGAGITEEALTALVSRSREAAGVVLADDVAVVAISSEALSVVGADS